MIYDDKYLQEMFDRLPTWKDDTEVELVEILKNKSFIKFIDILSRIKADAIADELDTQEDIDKAKYTRMGNKEIPALLNMIKINREERLR